MYFANSVASLLKKTTQGSRSVVDEMFVPAFAIGTIKTAFHGITLRLAIFSMRNSYEKDAPGLKHSIGFLQGSSRIRRVLQNMLHDHDTKGSLYERQVLKIPHLSFQALFAAGFDRVRGNVSPNALKSKVPGGSKRVPKRAAYVQ